MKIQIEDWAEKNLAPNAIELMTEAVMCYKVGAYRAAFLLSYLAFKTTIRERVLMAVKPDTIDDKCWEEQISIAQLISLLNCQKGVFCLNIKTRYRKGIHL